MSQLDLVLSEGALGSGRRDWWRGCVDGTLLPCVLKVCSTVELSIVLLDETLAVDFHVVDASDWESTWEGEQIPSPGD